MDRSVGHLEMVHQLVHVVGADVVHVSIVSIPVLLRPAGLYVPLLQLGVLVLPVLRRLALLDGGVLLPAVALARGGDHAGIQDQTLPRDVAGVLNLHRQLREQLVRQRQYLQPFPEQPDCPGIRKLALRG